MTEKEKQQEEHREEQLEEQLEEQMTSAAQADLAAARAELEASQAEAQANYDRWVRTQADFDNFRRRSRAEREELARYATESLILDLLPALDNLERALQTEADLADLRQGVEMTQRQLINTLQNHGLVPIEAAGLPFDPTLHEAVLQVETGQAVDGTVVTEVRRGYKLHEKVIRPTLVGVAKRA